MNFTSIEPSQHAILTQLDNGDEYVETRDSFPDVNYVVDDDVSIEVQDEEYAIEHETQPSYIRTTLRANGEKIVKKTKSTPRERVEKAVKRTKRSDVVDMMASYLEMRKKQSKKEAATLCREREEAKMREEASKRWKNSQMKKRSEFHFRIDTKCNGKRGFSVPQCAPGELGSPEPVTPSSKPAGGSTSSMYTPTPMMASSPSVEFATLPTYASQTSDEVLWRYCTITNLNDTTSPMQDYQL
ncbi:hypothetical protein E2562_002089 [Oryza meyeriana var. granulata]|uniref:Uncharacterized protein n=1 Tax=Oryza meyeriana var. granulata TaxID=110450 RepID=A0A6G1EDM0_9ORYZ|nr:hypothetical protein E2562_002089 [Oryza meyeriana var. granulata]